LIGIIFHIQYYTPTMHYCYSRCAPAGVRGLYSGWVAICSTWLLVTDGAPLASNRYDSTVAGVQISTLRLSGWCMSGRKEVPRNYESRMHAAAQSYLWEV